MNIAGIDCGTNSIRLLISQVRADGSLEDCLRRMEIVRLGQGVDETGRFADDALERTLNVVREYADECKKYEVTSLRFGATSATRDAQNRDIFLNGVHSLMGVTPHVITGVHEASLSFQGALGSLVSSPQMSSLDSDGHICVVDVGGGSTEIVIGNMHGNIEQAFSMNVGSVRIKERYLHDDPPTGVQIKHAQACIEKALDEAEHHLTLSGIDCLIGVAGTATTCAADYLHLDFYDSQAIHASVIPVNKLYDIADNYMTTPVATLLEKPYMHEGRADVMPAGALVWSSVVQRIAKRMEEKGNKLQHVLTSEHDILDGITLWALREPQSPSFA
ncbi:MAG: exopolyphosphatase [Actinomycetaceae bacterium]|nr:exopolyphosphatase [Actinomycetaceae bacterium]